MSTEHESLRKLIQQSLSADSLAPSAELRQEIERGVGFQPASDTESTAVAPAGKMPAPQAKPPRSRRWQIALIVTAALVVLAFMMLPERWRPWSESEPVALHEKQSSNDVSAPASEGRAESIEVNDPDAAFAADMNAEPRNDLPALETKDIHSEFAFDPSTSPKGDQPHYMREGYASGYPASEGAGYPSGKSAGGAGSRNRSKAGPNAEGGSARMSALPDAEPETQYEEEALQAYNVEVPEHLAGPPGKIPAADRSGSAYGMSAKVSTGPATKKSAKGSGKLGRPRTGEGEGQGAGGTNLDFAFSQDTFESGASQFGGFDVEDKRKELEAMRNALGKEQAARRATLATLQAKLALRTDEKELRELTEEVERLRRDIRLTQQVRDEQFSLAFGNEIDRGSNPGTEQYDAIYDNPFLPVGDAPLSTFSIDVDTASYSNVRRFLTQRHVAADGCGADRGAGQLLPLRLSRSPTGEDPFSVNIEVAGCPWKPEHRLVRVGPQGEGDSPRQAARQQPGVPDRRLRLDEPARTSCRW